MNEKRARILSSAFTQSAREPIASLSMLLLDTLATLAFSMALWLVHIWLPNFKVALWL
ncbi:MAG: hypothetical protein ACFE0Q_12660 [Anaerolineae bacterium]